MTNDHALKQNALATRAPDEGGWEQHLIYAVLFVTFLVAAVLSRFVPWHWPRLICSWPGRSSVVSEARSAASKAIPFVYMG
jgi:hypothetical protein